MSCFQLPKTLCNDLERIMRNFSWGQRNWEKKLAWVSWKKLCKSKLYGGMGFQNLQTFNLALLAKQGWQILSNPNSLMARVYKAKYFPYDDIFNAKLGSNPSYAWRSIFNSLEVIRKALDGGWEMARESIFGMTSGFQLQPLIKWSPLRGFLRISQCLVLDCRE